MSIVEKSAAAVLAQYLNDQGLGTYQPTEEPWPLSYGDLPSDPDDCIAIMDTAGTTQGRTPDEYVERHGIAVLVRSLLYPDGYAKAANIVATLDAIKRELQVYDGQAYVLHSHVRTTHILHVGKRRDDNRREHFSVNGLLNIQRTAYLDVEDFTSNAVVNVYLPQATNGGTNVTYNQISGVGTLVGDDWQHDFSVEPSGDYPVVIDVIDQDTGMTHRDTFTVTVP